NIDSEVGIPIHEEAPVKVHSRQKKLNVRYEQFHGMLSKITYEFLSVPPDEIASWNEHQISQIGDKLRNLVPNSKGIGEAAYMTVVNYVDSEKRIQNAWGEIDFDNPHEEFTSEL